MVNFIIKKVAEDSPHYNLTFMKKVKKRNGEIVEESGDTFYTLSIENVKNRIAHIETALRLNNLDVSLSRYISEFGKSYKEVCELLKKTL